MRLATAQQVLTALALQDRGENLQSANEGLNEVTPIIEHVLGTSVYRADREDLFCIDKLWERDSNQVFWPGGVKLLLKAGFVVEDQTVRVDSFGTLEDAANKDDPVRTPKNAVFTSFEDGVVKTVSEIGEWLRIRYAAGFTETNGDFQDVPSWLQRAAVSGAIRYMKAFQQKWNAKDIRDTKQEIHRLMEMHLTAKIRTKYGTFPYHTKESC